MSLGRSTAPSVQFVSHYGVISLNIELSPSFVWPLFEKLITWNFQLQWLGEKKSAYRDKADSNLPLASLKLIQSLGSYHFYIFFSVYICPLTSFFFLHKTVLLWGKQTTNISCHNVHVGIKGFTTNLIYGDNFFWDILKLKMSM